MRWLAPSLDERPELADQSVTCEHRGCFGRTCRLPAGVEASPIPVRTELIERLRLDDRAARKPLGLEPSIKFAFRPEGGDVRSGEADIIPEMSGWHQEMDQCFAENSAAGHAELNRLAGCRRVRFERAFTKKREY